MATPSTLALPYHNWPEGFKDIAVADFNNDGVPDIVTAEKGAPNILYLGDASLPGDYTTVTANRPMLPIPLRSRTRRPGTRAHTRALT